MTTTDTYTAEDAHAAAARGAEWLDQKCPGWPDLIDLETLRLEDAEVCILGQTADCILGPMTRQERRLCAGGYFRVLDAEGWELGGERQRELGFDVTATGDWEARELCYEMLTIAWSSLVKERLAASVA